MKHFRKEAVLFAIVLVVAVVGLLQLFHEDTYAVGYCVGLNCPPGQNCNGSCMCPTGEGTYFLSTCDACLHSCR